MMTEDIQIMKDKIDELEGKVQHLSDFVDSLDVENCKITNRLFDRVVHLERMNKPTSPMDSGWVSTRDWKEEVNQP